MKKFIKKHPIISSILGLVAVVIGGYIILLIIIIRPISMINGRMSSYDKSWTEIEKNIAKLEVGMAKKDVIDILGKPDDKYVSSEEIVLSYQQYGVVAAHWVYDIEISNDTIISIQKYEW